jgi:hypothetical protein
MQPPTFVTHPLHISTSLCLFSYYITEIQHVCNPAQVGGDIFGHFNVFSNENVILY